MRTCAPMKSLQEECGIVAFYNTKAEKNVPLALLAADGVQHRGQNGAGMAVKTRGSLDIYKGNGLLHDIFTTNVLKKFQKPSQWILIHCRYGTFGNYLKKNLQPCVVRTKTGERIVVAHNGEFVAVDDMKKNLSRPMTAGISDTYLFTELLSRAKGKNWDEKVLSLLSQTKGSYNLVIGIDDALYIARDPFGIRPLSIGKKDNGWMVASETHAFDKVGVQVERSVRKGEVIKINKKGITILNRESAGPHHFCDFEWSYFSRPDSLLSVHEKEKPAAWLSVNAFRERCGAEIAKEFPIKNASFVVGLPDSGIAVAIGYATTLRLPYRQLIIRDHYDPNAKQRLFMRDDEKNKIGKKVLGKLSLVPDKAAWKNAIVVLGDDSIVRGNVSKQITEAILALGAKEVHWIVGFPPVQHKCHLGVSMRTHEELIAARQQGNPKKIAEELGATSVNYISHKAFIRSRLLSGKIIVPENDKEIFLKNGGCGGCITGIYPVQQDGKHFSAYKHMQTESDLQSSVMPTTKKRPAAINGYHQGAAQTLL